MSFEPALAFSAVVSRFFLLLNIAILPPLPLPRGRSRPAATSDSIQTSSRAANSHRPRTMSVGNTRESSSSSTVARQQTGTRVVLLRPRTLQTGCCRDALKSTADAGSSLITCGPKTAPAWLRRARRRRRVLVSAPTPCAWASSFLSSACHLRGKLLFAFSSPPNAA